MAKEHYSDDTYGREVIYGYEYNARGFTEMKTRGVGLGGVYLTAPPPFGGPPLPDELRLTRENQVIVSSDMIALGDAVLFGFHGNPSPYRFMYVGPLAAGAPDPGVLAVLGIRSDELALMSARWMRLRHGGRWNIGFCDGHQETLSTKALFNYRSDDVLRRWNRDHLPHRELQNGPP